MVLDPVSGTVLANWLWENHGQSIGRTVFGKARDTWMKFAWAKAARDYRSRLLDQHSTTRLLGHSSAINLHEVFTEVPCEARPPDWLVLVSQAWLASR